jgi:hypothetical protein
MSNIPEWLEEATNGIFASGYESRVMHPYREDGTPCSINKSGAEAEACGLYRKANGWYVHCFRCGHHHMYKDGMGDPESVRRKLARIKSEPAYESVAIVQLPEDYVPMQSVDSPIPMNAWHWCWNAGLEDEDIQRFELGYSPSYDRVIIPCRTYGILTPSGDYVHKLMGWIGREVKYASKEQRKLHHCVKYLTKKSNAIKHLMFVAPSTSTRVVLVEDALSAIRINRATDFMAIALLTTYIPKKLMMKLQGYQVTIWLDGDMMAKSIGYATQMSRLGIRAKYCCTPEDPKYYNDGEIRDFLDKEIK